MIENMPHLIRLRNGERVQNTLSAQEYAQRTTCCSTALSATATRLVP
jgi:hypothetical protein